MSGSGPLSGGQHSSGRAKIRTRNYIHGGERDKANIVKGDWLLKLDGGHAGVLQRGVEDTGDEREAKSVRLSLPEQGLTHLMQLAR